MLEVKAQNIIHYAVHIEIAAQVVFNRADAEREFMGLQSFSGNRPHLEDVLVVKSYLGEKDLRTMGESFRATSTSPSARLRGSA